MSVPSDVIEHMEAILAAIPSDNLRATVRAAVERAFRPPRRVRRVNAPNPAASAVSAAARSRRPTTRVRSRNRPPESPSVPASAVPSSAPLVRHPEAAPRPEAARARCLDKLATASIPLWSSAFNFIPDDTVLPVYALGSTLVALPVDHHRRAARRGGVELSLARDALVLHAWCVKFDWEKNFLMGS
ncbi:hypothetical protein J8273_6939 [Carpediemonas membranifera]|uniref:Uncharacterized protein n=1 Tax=Carpediemonas membranifera TaxID=201153 RepID=A0A8J6E7G8_9EUKA|nr:hypothetical protein J8273_6939 [Carpediemonas membranifera]|eukprot:KAG9390700.1 hypothetical protein J8273_6939 [Carpediemonas membranifera]